MAPTAHTQCCRYGWIGRLVDRQSGGLVADGGSSLSGGRCVPFIHPTLSPCRFWDNRQEKKHPWFMFILHCESADGHIQYFPSNAFPVHQYYPTGPVRRVPLYSHCIVLRLHAAPHATPHVTPHATPHVAAACQYMNLNSTCGPYAIVYRWCACQVVDLVASHTENTDVPFCVRMVWCVVCACCSRLHSPLLRIRRKKRTPTRRGAGRRFTAS